MGEFPRAEWSGRQHSQDTDGASLMDAISRGSVPAFVELFDRTAVSVRAVLAALPVGAGQRDEILAATYLEVWWLAGCHTGPDLDAAEWIAGIARRRIAELHIGVGTPGDPVINGSAGPGYARLELATLLRRPVDALVRE